MTMAIAQNSAHKENWPDRVREYLEQHGISQTDFARMLGFNNSSGLNQYLKGTYKSPESFERKLVEFFGTAYEAEQLHSMPDYVPTSISKAIYGNIRLVHLKGSLVIETGDTGIGKTKTAQKYLKDYPASAYVVTATSVHASKNGFLRLLSRTLHLPKADSVTMWENVVEALSGARKVLIIDEAQQLHLQTINMLRQITDAVPTLGIAFLGNPGVFDKMEGRREIEADQVIGRRLRGEIRKTTHTILGDIQMLFPDITDPMSQEFLLGIAHGRKGIRAAATVYSSASDNGNVTYDGLVAAAKFARVGL